MIKKFLGCIVFFVCASWLNVDADTQAVDKVLVVVNDEVVTQREFDKVFGSIKAEYEARFGGDELKYRLEELRKALLEQLVNSKLIISLAKKKDVKINEGELKERVDKIKTYYSSEDEFLMTLSAKGTNLTEFEEEIREQMLSQKFIEEEISSKIFITPAEIRDVYEKNKEKFIAPKKVRARTIMLRKSQEALPDEVRKKMEDIVKELEAGGDFAELASKYSEGPYRASGGDMGYVIPGQMLEEIDQTLFALKKGELSGIIETNIGYHIFRVEDTEEGRTLSINEVSNFIREQIHMKKFEENMSKWLSEKKKNAYISYK